MTTRIISLWRVDATSLTTIVSTMRFLVEIMSVLEATKSLFRSPGRSPGRATVLPPASALALAFASVLAAASALAKC